MSVVPGPSASRGEITLQPTYFTSSLYVEPCREDLSALIAQFTQTYLQPDAQRGNAFLLFKNIWNEQGWCWLHLKVFDARARDTFLNVTARIFTERLLETEPPLDRVAALFALYCFHFTQPSSSAPALHAVRRISLNLDVYQSILALSAVLDTEELTPICPQTTYILSKLLDSKTFEILPSSELYPMNPRELPREIFVRDDDELEQPETTLKKKGRPSKRDKQKRAKDALSALDSWLEKSSFVYQQPGNRAATSTTHVLVSHPPTSSRDGYRGKKAVLLNALGPDEVMAEGQQALMRANEAVLTRLKEIDEMAASQGMEVGGEGGEKTGLARVEKAVADLKQGTTTTDKRGGILSLLEGSGLNSETVT